MSEENTKKAGFISAKMAKAALVGLFAAGSLSACTTNADTGEGASASGCKQKQESTSCKTQTSCKAQTSCKN